MFRSSQLLYTTAYRIFRGLICEHPLCLKHVQSCTELIILLYFWETAVVVISTISSCDGGGGVGVEVLFECSDVH